MIISDFEKMILEQYNPEVGQPTAVKINKELANPVAKELGLPNEQKKLIDLVKPVGIDTKTSPVKLQNNS